MQILEVACVPVTGVDIDPEGAIEGDRAVAGHRKAGDAVGVGDEDPALGVGGDALRVEHPPGSGALSPQLAATRGGAVLEPAAAGFDPDPEGAIEGDLLGAGDRGRERRQGECYQRNEKRETPRPASLARCLLVSPAFHLPLLARGIRKQSPTDLPLLTIRQPPGEVTRFGFFETVDSP